MNRSLSETGDNSKLLVAMEHAQKRKFADFVDFLAGLIAELNRLAAEGCVVLVEGARDVHAMRGVGYKGGIMSVSSVRRRESESLLAGYKRVIIMTDLDAEGRRLAARFSKSFAHRGLSISLDQRRRLLVASRGVFRHIENLKRFSQLVADVEVHGAEI